MQLHGDQRTRVGIENPVRLRDADQLVAEVLARCADCHHLRVLAELVVDLAIARYDFVLQFGRIDQRLAGELVHALDELGQSVANNEVRAELHEAFDRLGRALANAAQHEFQTALGQIRILL